MQGIPLLLDSLLYFLIFHTIGPTDFLHPSAAPLFKILQVLLTYFPKCFVTNLQNKPVNTNGG
jgi:hypothetical protein